MTATPDPGQRQFWRDLRKGFRLMLQSLCITGQMAWATLTAIPFVLRRGGDPEADAELDRVLKDPVSAGSAASLRRMADRIDGRVDRSTSASTPELLEQQDRTLIRLRREVACRVGTTPLEREIARYTVLWRLDIRPALAMSGADALRWILSRIEDESQENLAHDHWHPELAGPLQILVMAVRQALERAGERTVWLSADGYTEVEHDVDARGPRESVQGAL